MTYNKRFKIDNTGMITDYLEQKVYAPLGNSKDVFELFELLNRNWEQTKRFEKSNQELSNEIVKLKTDVDYYKVKSGSCETVMYSLQRENVDLKSDMDSFKKEVMTIIARYWKKNTSYLTISEVLELILKDLDLELIL